MKSLILALLNDPFGVSGETLGILLDIYSDDEGDEAMEELEGKLIEIELHGHIRHRLPE